MEDAERAMDVINQQSCANLNKIDRRFHSICEAPNLLESKERSQRSYPQDNEKSY